MSMVVACRACDRSWENDWGVTANGMCCKNMSASHPPSSENERDIKMSLCSEKVELKTEF